VQHTLTSHAIWVPTSENSRLGFPSPALFSYEVHCPLVVGCHVLISLIVHDKNLCVNWFCIWPQQGLPRITGHHAAFRQIGSCLHMNTSIGWQQQRQQRCKCANFSCRMHILYLQLIAVDSQPIIFQVCSTIIKLCNVTCSTSMSAHVAVWPAKC